LAEGTERSIKGEIICRSKMCLGFFRFDFLEMQDKLMNEWTVDMYVAVAAHPYSVNKCDPINS